MSQERFTPVERRMLAVLGDSMYHTTEELVACLYDTDGSYTNIQAHISNIRKKIPSNQLIIAEFRRRRIGYRHVELLHSAVDGKV